jgi:hypothetical protein
MTEYGNWVSKHEWCTPQHCILANSSKTFIHAIKPNTDFVFVGDSTQLMFAKAAYSILDTIPPPYHADVIIKPLNIRFRYMKTTTNFTFATRNTVLILNEGAHYKSIPEYAEMMRILSNSLPKDIPIFWRYTLPGFPACEHFPQQPLSVPNFTTWNHYSIYMTNFNWHMFPFFNTVAEQFLVSKNVNFLDFTYMTSLRPDAYTRIRHAGGKLPPDCLHMKPSNVPSVWLSILLWHMKKLF